ncbi:hypothetical protein RhiLY_14391 [Ceratobasidium sp. AG-Ba]|nr:hypothetical protein RhiLY_14391 [Ceratobasidium sp. AG-Ba]
MSKTGRNAIAPLVQSNVAQNQRPRPFYQNCLTWNEGVSFVKNGFATPSNNEQLLPRPIRKVMSPQVYSQLINHPAVLILEDDDEIIPYSGPEQESTVVFSRRADDIFGTPENVVPFNLAVTNSGFESQVPDSSQAASSSAPSSQPGPLPGPLEGENVMRSPPKSPVSTLAEEDDVLPPLIGAFHSHNRPLHNLLGFGFSQYRRSPERPSGSAFDGSQLSFTHPPVSIESEGGCRLLAFVLLDNRCVSTSES